MHTPNSFDPFINLIDELLDQYLSSPSFNVEKLSQQLRSNRMKVYRKVKQHTGFSPSEYIRFRRLKMAAEQLTNTTKKICQISAESGFSKPAYFSKCFKDQYGCTPTSFIKKYRSVELKEYLLAL